MSRETAVAVRRKAAKLAQGSSTEPIDPQTASTLARMDPDRINYELIDKLVDHIDRTNPRCDGAILIFMPGMAEINMCCEELRGNPHLSRCCVIFNLHSSLGNVDQKAVFGKPRVFENVWHFPSIAMRNGKQAESL